MSESSTPSMHRHQSRPGSGLPSALELGCGQLLHGDGTDASECRSRKQILHARKLDRRERLHPGHHQSIAATTGILRPLQGMDGVGRLRQPASSMEAGSRSLQGFVHTIVRGESDTKSVGMDARKAPSRNPTLSSFSVLLRSTQFSPTPWQLAPSPSCDDISQRPYASTLQLFRWRSFRIIPSVALTSRLGCRLPCVRRPEDVIAVEQHLAIDSRALLIAVRVMTSG